MRRVFPPAREKTFAFRLVSKEEPVHSPVFPESRAVDLFSMAKDKSMVRTGEHAVLPHHFENVVSNLNKMSAAAATPIRWFAVKEGKKKPQLALDVKIKVTDKRNKKEIEPLIREIIECRGFTFLPYSP
ncbi:MAG: hypothetical protein V1811_02060 [Candidatus Micrarchaeota archaeon]